MIVCVCVCVCVCVGVGSEHGPRVCVLEEEERKGREEEETGLVAFFAGTFGVFMAWCAINKPLNSECVALKRSRAKTCCGAHATGLRWRRSCLAATATALRRAI